MRIGHWDATFGFAGDMALGALLDAGARPEAVNAALAALGIAGLRVDLGRGLRCGLDCARVHVRWDGDGHGGTPEGTERPHHADHGHHHTGAPPHGHADHAHDDHQDPHAHPWEAPVHHAHRPYSEIRALLTRSPLPGGVRDRAHAVFARLAEAEGRIHGRDPSEVHFHEVGGEDAIGDIVGVAAALDHLGIEGTTVGPLPAGGGTVRAAHGRLPVPAPAVALLLEGFDWQPGPVEAELVTPTGAAILAALATPRRSWPAFRLGGGGWGAGTRDFPGHPNACRFVWGSADTPAAGLAAETLIEIETHIDDQTPEAVGHLYEQVFAAGALDVATAPLWMKKQRPGVRFWALVRPAEAELVAACILRESTALGLRLREVRRWSLPRSTATVETRFGAIRIKIATLDGRVVNAAPEYEDCRAAADGHGVPLKAVFAAAVAAWEAQAGGPEATLP